MEERGEIIKKSLEQQFSAESWWILLRDNEAEHKLTSAPGVWSSTYAWAPPQIGWLRKAFSAPLCGGCPENYRSFPECGEFFPLLYGIAVNRGGEIWSLVDSCVILNSKSFRNKHVSVRHLWLWVCGLVASGAGIRTWQVCSRVIASPSLCRLLCHSVHGGR